MHCQSSAFPHIYFQKASRQEATKRGSQYQQVVGIRDRGQLAHAMIQLAQELIQCQVEQYWGERVALFNTSLNFNGGST